MSWKKVCLTDAVSENGLKLFDVDGVAILISNLGDNHFRAYPPLCPHMEEPLEQSGICEGGVLTCTKHLWQFDMRSGAPLGPAERPLLMYDVKTEGDDVMVYVDQELEYEFEDDDEDDFEF